MIYQTTRPHQEAIQAVFFVQLLQSIEQATNHIMSTRSLTSTEDNAYIHQLVFTFITWHKLNERHSVCMWE